MAAERKPVDLILQIGKEVKADLAACGVSVTRDEKSVFVSVRESHSRYDRMEPLPGIVLLWDEAVMRLTIERAKRAIDAPLLEISELAAASQTIIAVMRIAAEIVAGCVATWLDTTGYT